MKRCAVILMVVAAAGFASSCIVVPDHEVMSFREGGPRESTLSVQQEPPALQAEAVTGAPAPTHVWVAGYWWWDGRWVWVSGRWVSPPRPQAAWVPGRWDRRQHGWVWVGGYWRY